MHACFTDPYTSFLHHSNTDSKSVENLFNEKADEYSISGDLKILRGKKTALPEIFVFSIETSCIQD